MSADLYRWVLWSWMGLAPVVLVLLLFISAPYGRHVRRGWGASVPSTVGWVVMETPSLALMVTWFALGSHRSAPTWVFLGLWVAHYGYRVLVFPALRRGGGRPMPLVVVALAMGFNFMNALVNGVWLFELGPERDASWLLDLRFLVGAALFAAGFVTHVWADRVLRRLRRPGERGYAIPRGGLYERVSSPNYLGEMAEWGGFALLTWSWSGASFFLWTVANLLPRALTNHRWYEQTFEDYPAERRALVPWLL